MEAIKKIEAELKGKTIELASLDRDTTALFVVDMVKGFVYTGPLASPRVAGIVENIVALNKRMKGWKKVFFLDSHEKDSLEFMNFPSHCLRGDQEAELIDDLKTEDSEGPETFYIEKNSTNGFHSQGFKVWLKEYEDQVDTYVVAGCVTDICVQQFAITLKTYFNEKNKPVRVILPANAVETYSFGSHEGDLINLLALYNMHICGIEVIDKIK